MFLVIIYNLIIKFLGTKENLDLKMQKLAKFIVYGEIQQCHLKTAQQVVNMFEQLRKDSFRVFA